MTDRAQNSDPAATGSADPSSQASPHPLNRPISRRAALKRMGALGLASATTLTALETLAWAPQRAAHAAPAGFPDIQFDIGAYIPPVYPHTQVFNSITFNLPPVYTLFVTATLTRTPGASDQQVLGGALDTIEASYPFSPSGVFALLGYGVPYFSKLAGGLTGSLVSGIMPRLVLDTSRYALEEAVPGPTDLVSTPPNPYQVKPNFPVPVSIEANDVLMVLRSDRLENLTDVMLWLQGSNRLNSQQTPSPTFDGLFTITSLRLMFVQVGLPRKMAEHYGLPFSSRINKESPMWMGFSSQQAGTAASPASVVCFQGRVPDVVFATGPSGAAMATSDYFYNGSIMHLSHDIVDLYQWYACDPRTGELAQDPDQTYANRAQYMFRSDPQTDVSLFQGNHNQFAGGGGTAFLPNEFLGTGDAVTNAQMGRMGHVPALQRGSRAADGTPIHIRWDGPGFTNMDVPGGAVLPALEFGAFLPTAEKFRQGRIATASLDLAQQYNIPPSHAGIERFLTSTRRQNYLIPPRAHRAFPLAELA